MKRRLSISSQTRRTTRKCNRYAKICTTEASLSNIVDLASGTYTFYFENVAFQLAIERTENTVLNFNDGCLKMRFLETSSEVNELMYLIQDPEKQCPGYKPKGYGTWLLRLVDALNIVFDIIECRLVDASSRRSDHKSLNVFLMAARGYTFYMGTGYVVYHTDEVCKNVEITNMYIKEIHDKLNSFDQTIKSIKCFKNEIKRLQAALAISKYEYTKLYPERNVKKPVNSLNQHDIARDMLFTAAGREYSSIEEYQEDLEEYLELKTQVSERTFITVSGKLIKIDESESANFVRGLMKRLHVQDIHRKFIWYKFRVKNLEMRINQLYTTLMYISLKHDQGFTPRDIILELHNQEEEKNNDVSWKSIKNDAYRLYSSGRECSVLQIHKSMIKYYKLNGRRVTTVIDKKEHKMQIIEV